MNLYINSVTRNFYLHLKIYSANTIDSCFVMQIKISASNCILILNVRGRFSRNLIEKRQRRVLFFTSSVRPLKSVDSSSNLRLAVERNQSNRADWSLHGHFSQGVRVAQRLFSCVSMRASALVCRIHLTFRSSYGAHPHLLLSIDCEVLLVRSEYRGFRFLDKSGFYSC
jgi:hypothetical protein